MPISAPEASYQSSADKGDFGRRLRDRTSFHPPHIGYNPTQEVPNVAFVTRPRTPYASNHASQAPYQHPSSRPGYHLHVSIMYSLSLSSNAVKCCRLFLATCQQLRPPTLRVSSSSNQYGSGQAAAALRLTRRALKPCVNLRTIAIFPHTSLTKVPFPCALLITHLQAGAEYRGQIYLPPLN